MRSLKSVQNCHGPSSVLNQGEEAIKTCVVCHSGHMITNRYEWISSNSLTTVCTYLVKQIFEKDGQPINPFSENLPRKRWLQIFRQHHLEISLRKPNHLRLARAKCCTNNVMQSWFTNFEQFLLLHNFMRILWEVHHSYHLYCVGIQPTFTSELFFEPSLTVKTYLLCKSATMMI